MWGQLSTTFSNALKQPTGELQVVVNHNQLRTMASETVDPIDWSHPSPLWAVPPERLMHSINQCTSAESNVQPQHARQPPCLCGHSGYQYFYFFTPNSKCALVVTLSEKRKYHGYRKWRTHARVFAQSLAHGNARMK